MCSSSPSHLTGRTSLQHKQGDRIVFIVMCILHYTKGPLACAWIWISTLIKQKLNHFLHSPAFLVMGLMLRIPPPGLSL